MASPTIETPKLTFFQILQRNFIAGLFLLLPLVVSIYILVWLYTTITDPTVQLLKKIYPGLQKEQWSLELSVFAFCFNLSLVFVVGLLTRYVIGRKAFYFMEALMSQVPVLNKIYAGTKQIIQGFSPDQKNGFQKVVLVEFPRVGSYMLGFVVGTTSSAVVEPAKEPMFNVFVPTTPNPTSGFLLMVAAKQVRTVDISVAEAIKIVISVGSVMPDQLKYLENPTI